jgi:archaellum component FlaG (FlaF/FlaG flagellin family)
MKRLLAIIVFAGLALGACEADTVQESDEPTPTAAPTTTAGDTAEETTTTEEVEETTTTEAAPVAAGLGDAVRDGKFEFVVTSVETGVLVLGDPDILPDEAKGEFIVFTMTVENIGAEAQSFSAGSQKLVKDGIEYDAEGFLWTEESVAFEELNPGISIETLVVFDLAPGFDLTGSTLELHDSVFSGGVEVAL